MPKRSRENEEDSKVVLCIPTDKKKTKRTKRSQCEHFKERNKCIQCKKEGTGGSAICDDHLKRKNSCKECGGIDICEHKHRRSQCKECKENGTGGSSLCEHKRQRSTCKECKAKG